VAKSAADEVLTEAGLGGIVSAVKVAERRFIASLATYYDPRSKRLLITYAVRDRAHLWGLRPAKWLMLSTCADVLFISVLANRGLAMAPLSLLVLVTILSASLAFWMILNLLKIPIFKALNLS
jgi:hypothetical protein